MAISIQRYVAITSGVGGGNNVRQRDLIARVFTQNPLVPTQSFIEFSNSADVGTFFGTSSEEYARAVFYFGFISKNITAPERISFARWANVDTAPIIYGRSGNQALANYTSITTGAFALTIGATTNQITGMNFSGATSLANVASIVQTAIRTQTGTMWTAATVTYDAINGRFIFTGGATGANAISIAAPSSGTDISAIIGWLDATAILSNGVLAESVTTTLTNSDNASSNFGTFLFTKASAVSLQNVVDAATWNNALNVKYAYSQGVSAANAGNWSAALLNLSGVELTLDPITTEYPDMAPAMIMAATRYNQRNATQNYMFYSFALTPSVTTNAVANTYDALRVNYYGVTQTAGQLRLFYQRGVMMGLSTDPVDMNTYANEVWLKDYAQAQIMTLLLSLAKVSANTQGKAQLKSILQGCIDLGLFNTTISVGKPLNVTQQLYIAQITVDQLAWRQVQNLGYWFDVTFSTVTTTDGRTEYQANYILVYSKDDTVRKVVGQHILI